MLARIVTATVVVAFAIALLAFLRPWKSSSDGPSQVTTDPSSEASQDQAHPLVRENGGQTRAIRSPHKPGVHSYSNKTVEKFIRVVDSISGNAIPNVEVQVLPPQDQWGIPSGAGLRPYPRYVSDDEGRVYWDKQTKSLAGHWLRLRSRGYLTSLVTVQDAITSGEVRLESGSILTVHSTPDLWATEGMSSVSFRVSLSPVKTTGRTIYGNGLLWIDAETLRHTLVEPIERPLLSAREQISGLVNGASYWMAVEGNAGDKTYQSQPVIVNPPEEITALLHTDPGIRVATEIPSDGRCFLSRGPTSYPRSARVISGKGWLGTGGLPDGEYTLHAWGSTWQSELQKVNIAKGHPDIVEVTLKTLSNVTRIVKLRGKGVCDDRGQIFVLRYDTQLGVTKKVGPVNLRERRRVCAVEKDRLILGSEVKTALVLNVCTNGVRMVNENTKELVFNEGEMGKINEGASIVRTYGRQKLQDGKVVVNLQGTAKGVDDPVWMGLGRIRFSSNKWDGAREWSVVVDPRTRYRLQIIVMADGSEERKTIFREINVERSNL